MGLMEGSEPQELVDYFRSVRTMTAEEVDATGADHPALLRYEIHTGPSAATAAAH